MNPPTAARASPVGGIAAGLCLFLAWPLSLMALGTVGLASDPDSSFFENLALAWNEGGVSMYAVSLVAALAAVTGAVLLFISATRGRAAVLGLAPVAALATLAGTVVAKLGMTNVMDAVLHASPADQATIMAAATGESLRGDIYGLLSTSALLFSGALGTAVAALVRRGKGGFPVLLAGLTFLALALVHFAWAWHLSNLRTLFRLVAQVSPGDWPKLLVSGAELGPVVPFLAGGLVLLALVLAAGAATQRASPATAVVLVVLGATGLLGIGSVVLFNRTAAKEVRAYFSSRPALPMLLHFDGQEVGKDPWLFISAEGITQEMPEWEEPVEPGPVTDETLLPLLLQLAESEYIEGDEPLQVGLREGTRPRELWRLLRTVASAGVHRIQLVGLKRVDISGAPAELEPIAWLMRDVYQGLDVMVVTQAEFCAEPCTFVPLVGPLKGKGDVVVKADGSSSIEALLTAARAAEEAHRPLVLVFP